MESPFSRLYPNIAYWVEACGWTEIGQHCEIRVHQHAESGPRFQILQHLLTEDRMVNRLCFRR